MKHCKPITFEEAEQVLLSGGRVKMRGWPDGSYVEIEDMPDGSSSLFDASIVDEDGLRTHLPLEAVNWVWYDVSETWLHRLWKRIRRNRRIKA